MAKANRPKAGSWKNFLGNSSARPYLESCKTIADFDYIDFLEFSESQRLTKDQCEAQWNEALDQLMVSNHNGLQKQAVFLKKQWKYKAHSDDADVFWSKVKRKRGLDKGTLDVQAAVDAHWNKRVREEYERETDDISGWLTPSFADVDKGDNIEADIEALEVMEHSRLFAEGSVASCQGCLLSGILHLNKSHIGFTEKEIKTISKEVLENFYSQEMRDEDIQQAEDASTQRTSSKTGGGQYGYPPPCNIFQGFS
ncbi:hypothetical protein BGZ81_009695 [Podila clonocystis]|nr:hypothetical protein BGZ81_009695 [Podila clonocystis]